MLPDCALIMRTLPAAISNDRTKYRRMKITSCKREDVHVLAFCGQEMLGDRVIAPNAHNMSDCRVINVYFMQLAN